MTYKQATSDQANWSGTAGANGKTPQTGDAGRQSGFWSGVGQQIGSLGSGLPRTPARPQLRAPQVPKATAQSAAQATPTPKPQPPKAPQPQQPAQLHPFLHALGQTVGSALAPRGGSALSQAAYQHTQQLGLNPFNRGQSSPAAPGGAGGFDPSSLLSALPAGLGGATPAGASPETAPPASPQPTAQTGAAPPPPGVDWINGTQGETLGETAVNLPVQLAANQGLTSAAVAGFNRFKGTGVGQALGFQAPAGSGLTAAQRARVMLRPRNLGRNLRGGAANMAAVNTGLDALANAPNAFRNYKALATGQQYDPAVQQQYLDHAENLGSQNILRRAWGGFSQPITTIASGAHAVPEIMQLRQQQQDFAYRTRGTPEEQINRHANSNAAGIQDAQQATPDLWYQDSSSGQMLPTRKWMSQVNSPEETAQRDRVLKRLGLPSGWSPAQ